MTWSAPWMSSQPSNRLGAIIGRGERLEYRLSDELLKRIGIDESVGAFCSGSPGQFANEIVAHLPTGPFDPIFGTKLHREMNRTVEQIDREFVKVGKMRGGRQGRISMPLCVFRKDRKPYFQEPNADKYMRRAEGTHERFHAAVRNAEMRSGMYPDEPCVGATMGMLLRQQAQKEFDILTYIGDILRWSDDPIGMPEEILARSEEIRKACLVDMSTGNLRNPSECGTANRVWGEQFDMINRISAEQHIKANLPGPPPQISASLLWDLTQAVKRKYGSPFGLANAAVMRCAGSKFRPSRKALKRKGQKARAKVRKAAAPKKSTIEFT